MPQMDADYASAPPKSSSKKTALIVQSAISALHRNRGMNLKTLKIREICVICDNLRFSILLSESRIIADDADERGLCFRPS